MWKHGGGRSTALDRAQALLSGERSGRGAAESVRGAAAETRSHTGAVGGSVKTRCSSPNTHLLLSDVSDLSSVSSAPDRGDHTRGSAAAAAAAAAASAAGKTQKREGDSTKDLRPQSSLSGGGSRFLKKAPPPATNSSQSPVSRGQTQQVPEPRNVSFSRRGSQTAALSRLAEIESRIRSRKQAQEQASQEPKPAGNLTSDLRISPPPAAPSLLEAAVQLSPQSSSDNSPRGKHFLKNKTTVAVSDTRTVTARSSEGVRSRSRAIDAVVSLAGLKAKSAGVVSGVSLESDEEDMRKLLGDSLDSTDYSFLKAGKPSSTKTAGKMLSKSSQRFHPSPPPAAVPPSSSSPTAPSRRGSPFRFTGQPQAHFSPSVLSLSPSPPRASSSPPGRLTSPHRARSPQRSLSSMSDNGEVLSLAELFPVGPDSEDPHSDMSAVSSEDFKINVMTLDDLVPATLDVAEETPGKEREAKHSVPPPESPNRHQQKLKEKKKEEEEQQQQEEEDVDYQSDFESESRTEPDHSASQISEHLQGDEEEVVSEVREEALDADMSPSGRTEDDYSSTFSDTSRSCTSRTSDQSYTHSRDRDSRSHDSRTSSCQTRRHTSTRKIFKEAAVQTQSDPLAYTWPTGADTLGPAVGATYMNPSPVAAHTLSADMVEALSTFNPAVFTLNEMLKQQLAMIRQCIESRRHLHSSLVQSLGPPNYRYTTLKDTKEYIHKHRPPKLTVEEALGDHRT